jgi:hypothetical protein
VRFTLLKISSTIYFLASTIQFGASCAGGCGNPVSSSSVMCPDCASK